MDPPVHAHCPSHVAPRRLRLQEEALAALPEGSGPGALTARERRPAEPPGPEAPRGRGHHERCRGLCDSSDLRIPRLHPRRTFGMQLLIYGPGRLGTAIAAAAVATGWPAPGLAVRPDAGGRRAEAARGRGAGGASAGGSVPGHPADAPGARNRGFAPPATGS